MPQCIKISQYTQFLHNTVTKDENPLLDRKGQPVTPSPII
jgi:hypothetical protein